MTSPAAGHSITPRECIACCSSPPAPPSGLGVWRKGQPAFLLDGIGADHHTQGQARALGMGLELGTAADGIGLDW